jgi:predicted nucleic acid-binding protein
MEVGPIALAHSDAPVSDTGLHWIRRAVDREIDLIVPYPAVFGAHHVLSSYYGYSSNDASRLLRNFLSIGRIHWVGAIDGDVSARGLAMSGDANTDGWDGLYAAVAQREGARTVLTIDDDFDRIDGIDGEVILSQAEFEQLEQYLAAL